MAGRIVAHLLESPVGEDVAQQRAVVVIGNQAKIAFLRPVKQGDGPFVAVFQAGLYGVGCLRIVTTGGAPPLYADKPLVHIGRIANRIDLSRALVQDGQAGRYFWLVGHLLPLCFDFDDGQIGGGEGLSGQRGQRATKKKREKEERFHGAKIVRR